MKEFYNDNTYNKIINKTDKELINFIDNILYKHLVDFSKGYNDTQNEETKKVTVCPTIKGSDGAKYMFVGRSINGWQDCKGDLQNVLKYKTENQAGNGKPPLDWVVNKYEVDNLAECKNIDKDDWHKSAISYSPFWQFIRYELNAEYKIDTSNTDWINNVIWSNLYKMSYIYGGKPSNSLCNQQLEICDLLLVAEIKLYNPTVVYFVTERMKKENKSMVKSWFVEKDFKYTYKYIKEHNIKAVITLCAGGKSNEDIQNAKVDINIIK